MRIFFGAAFRCFVGFSHRWKALPDLSSLHIQSIILDNYGIISKASATAKEAARWANAAYAINRSSGNSAPCSATSLPTHSTSNEGLPPAIKTEKFFCKAAEVMRADRHATNIQVKPFSEPQITITRNARNSYV